VFSASPLLYHDTNHVLRGICLERFLEITVLIGSLLPWLYWSWFSACRSPLDERLDQHKLTSKREVYRPAWV